MTRSLLQASNTGVTRRMFAHVCAASRFRRGRCSRPSGVADGRCRPCRVVARMFPCPGPYDPYLRRSGRGGRTGSARWLMAGHRGTSSVDTRAPADRGAVKRSSVRHGGRQCIRPRAFRRPAVRGSQLGTPRRNPPRAAHPDRLRDPGQLISGSTGQPGRLRPGCPVGHNLTPSQTRLFPPGSGIHSHGHRRSGPGQGPGRARLDDPKRLRAGGHAEYRRRKNRP
jgi:hypothetical protein